MIARSLCIAAVLLAAGGTGFAENVKVFGVTMSPMMGGGFKPAGTTLICTSLDEGRCYDGNIWHDLFPPGPRRYATDAPDKVVCMAIANGDCWTTARKWYRLPRGQLMGINAGVMSPTPGAFVTAPLR
ncbi:MAG TPA: hypothetical protein VFC45_07165 [Pseudolabrys sp.]|nr:hypothetical protein [Pseudolabrys sp.]